jgi:hypothetical protein
MICELFLKCVTLIAVIHGLRLLARRIGPRASGLLLGLPSSTAILLVLCGRERGSSSAIQMADASLLGLVAAVSLPVAYAHAVRIGWRLPAAIGAAVGCYVIVASGLGCLDPGGPWQRAGISFGSIVIASLLASQIEVPSSVRPGSPRSSRWALMVRTMVPISYVVVVAIVSRATTPGWAGLVSTFPSMSTVVLAVTQLETGPIEASRIARALPPANLSTAAFLTVFRFACPAVGLSWALAFGYTVALANLAAVELVANLIPMHFSFPTGRLRLFDGPGVPTSRILRLGLRRDGRSVPRQFGRPRTVRGRHFAPFVEILTC